MKTKKHNNQVWHDFQHRKGKESLNIYEHFSSFKMERSTIPNLLTDGCPFKLRLCKEDNLMLLSDPG